MNSTDFTPSENQKAVIAAFQEAHYDVKVTDACRKAGVDRTTYYTWFRDTAFSDWWLTQARSHFGLHLPRVYADLMRMSSGGEGNHSAAKTLLDRFDKGFLPTRRREVAQEKHDAIDLASMSDEELERLDQALGIQETLETIQAARDHLNFVRAGGESERWWREEAQTSLRREAIEAAVEAIRAEAKAFAPITAALKPCPDNSPT